MLRVAGSNPYISLYSMPANTFQGYRWQWAAKPFAMMLTFNKAPAQATLLWHK
jgi:hypothetical protein